MSSKILSSGGIPILFDPGDEDTAEMIRGVCEETLRIVRESWGLPPPGDCRILVMTSYFRWMFQAAPGPWRIYLGATVPLWIRPTRRMWPVSAGWTVRFGNKTAIGIKPPRLMALSDRSIGARIFVEEKDPAAKVRTTACHELTHACSSAWALPMWLNEGIAMAAVDQFAGRPTVRRDTLPLVRGFSPKKAPPGYREVQRMGKDAMAYHTARGYWLVRYLEQRHSGFIKELLSRRPDAKAVERAAAAESGIEPDHFWQEIDGELASHFEQSRSGV